MENRLKLDELIQARHALAIKEQQLYEKWIKIYQNEIQKEYPQMKEKQVLKLAQENARYLISIFTPATSMEYTVSLRQLNYILLSVIHIYNFYLKLQYSYLNQI